MHIASETEEFVPGDNGRSAAPGSSASYAQLEAEISQGLRAGEFSLHYQPISSARSGGVVGLEALIRWCSPRRGNMLPGTFIPIAEATGLIHPLGRWVLESACRQLADWDRNGLAFSFVAVNVSPVQIHSPDFLASVDEAITTSEISARRIVLEITEGLRVHETDHTRTVMQALRERGVGLAVDDFGIGYSSLSYLQALPLTKLKIDRSFVANLTSSRNDAAIVSALVGLAHTLGLDLVAEGVETEGQRALLVEMGCDLIQGWLVGRPVPARELSQQFATRQLKMHVGEATESICTPQ